MLLKGCQKKIICLRSSDSRLFDEAFFVLRDSPDPPAETDMLAEANRILDENLLCQRKKRISPLPAVLCFLLGGGFVGLLWLVFACLPL